MSKTDYTQSGHALQRQQAGSPAEQIKRHKAFLDARLPMLAKWVREGVRPEALIRFELLDLQQNEKLRDCTPESIYLGLLACAVTGLEPGALRGEAYLVPFAGKAQFMAGWKGLVKQARRSREVLGITANVVREADVFELDIGSDNRIVHRPALRGERGNVVGAYALAKMAGGHMEIEWMDREDLDSIQRVAESRSKSPAWKEWPDQMQRKSPIRRLAKRLPLGSDYYVGQAIEHANDEGSDSREVLDVVTDGEASKTEASAQAAQEMRAQVEGPDPDVAEIAEIERLERQSK